MKKKGLDYLTLVFSDYVAFREALHKLILRIFGVGLGGRKEVEVCSIEIIIYAASKKTFLIPTLSKIGFFCKVGTV